MASLSPRDDLHTENDDEGSECPRSKEQGLWVKVSFNGEEKGDWYCSLTMMVTINGYEKVLINDDLHHEHQYYQSLT
jgi:hypothetical protein